MYLITKRKNGDGEEQSPEEFSLKDLPKVNGHFLKDVCLQISETEIIGLNGHYTIEKIEGKTYVNSFEYEQGNKLWFLDHKKDIALFEQGMVSMIVDYGLVENNYCPKETYELIKLEGSAIRIIPKLKIARAKIYNALNVWGSSIKVIITPKEGFNYNFYVPFYCIKFYNYAEE